jgi:hypothetical protein
MFVWSLAGTFSLSQLSSALLIKKRRGVVIMQAGTVDLWCGKSQVSIYTKKLDIIEATTAIGATTATATAATTTAAAATATATATTTTATTTTTTTTTATTTGNGEKDEI